MNIIVDSGCDVSPEMQGGCGIFERVPLSLQVDSAQFIDDEKLDIDGYLSVMESSAEAVRTAAPSPQLFLEKFRKDGAAFVVTISSKLSASYNNAMLAKELYLEDARDKFIHVFDSLSATCGQTIIAMKIKEALANGLKDSEVVSRVESFMKSMKTFVVLEKYDNLVKNGRISPLIAKVAGVLNIRPICLAVDGEIAVVEKARGTRRALERLAEIIAETAAKEKIDCATRTLAISHAKCLDQANRLKDAVMEKIRFKNSIVCEMTGLCATYAQRGGVSVAF
jgi:DegV family protein with EDD domain